LKKRWILIFLFAFFLSWWWKSRSLPPPPAEPVPEVAVETTPTPPAEISPTPTASPTPTPSPSPIATATPKSALATPTPEDHIPLWLIIQRNELCRYVKLSPEMPDLGRALLQVAGGPTQPSADRVLNELYDLHGPFSGKINSQVALQSEPTQFYSALLAADLLTGQKLPKTNFENAEYLFAALEQMDPQNGAYPFFHAALLQKMKSNPHDIQMALLRALGATHFEIYLDEIQSRFYQRGLINPTGWLATKTLTSRLPSPIFSFSQALMISEVSLDPGEHLSLEKFGQLLTRKYKNDVQKNRTLNPNRFENDCGKAILESIHSSLVEEKPKSNDQAEQEYGDAYTKLKGQNSCETYLFDRLFFKFKNNFVY
jgi:hypothetical protein